MTDPELLRLLNDVFAILADLVRLARSELWFSAALLVSFVSNSVLWFLYAQSFRHTNRLLGELLNLHVKLLEILENQR